LKISVIVSLTEAALSENDVDRRVPYETLSGIISVPDADTTSITKICPAVLPASIVKFPDPEVTVSLIYDDPAVDKDGFTPVTVTEESSTAKLPPT
jgi:hypothetical protein